MTTEIRECSVCPEWVLKCAHYDSRWVALHHTPFSAGFAVCLGVGIPRALYLNFHRNPCDRYLFTDYDAALAAFSEAAERLVQGD